MYYLEDEVELNIFEMTITRKCNTKEQMKMYIEQSEQLTRIQVGIKIKSQNYEKYLIVNGAVY